MHRTFVLFSASALLIASQQLAAQTANSLGFTAGFDTSYIDRIGGTTTVGDVLQHFDDRDYLDWMINPTDLTGATYAFTGVRFILQDQVANTAENYDVVAYNEDPANLNFPLTTANWFRTGTIAYPAMPVTYPTPTGPIAWIITITFASPAVPKGPKWIGLGLPQPAVGTWPTDGLSPHTVWDFPAANTGTNALDVVGPGISSIPNNLSCFVQTNAGVPVGGAVYPASGLGLRRQLRLEVLAQATGGVCVTQTNQTRLPSSNPGVTNTAVPLGGTTNMLSGLNPDMNNFTNSTTPRADNIGFLVTDVNFPNSPVFLLQAFGPSPVGSIPTQSLGVIAGQPGTRGNVCIDFVTAELTIAFTNGTGIYQHLINPPPAVRTTIGTLRPLDVWYQAFVVNPAADISAPFELHSTGCGIQHL